MDAETRTRYEAWNQAIVDVMYGELADPRPVYLDFDDEPIARLAERMGIEPDAVVGDLTAAVVATVRSDATPSEIFSFHEHLMRTHRRGLSSTPGYVALLGMTPLRG